jgi:hypothetical protein
MVLLLSFFYVCRDIINIAFTGFFTEKKNEVRSEEKSGNRLRRWKSILRKSCW